jgi:uncharacterized protein (TIGR01777 family)
MKIVIAGGSGFLGRPLASRLLLSGHEVVILTRSEALGRAAGGLRYATWEPTGTPPESDRMAGFAGSGGSSAGAWSGELDGAGAVINLAGAGLADARWTAARKTELHQSRINSTRSLVEAMRRVKHRPALFVQESAVGFYGSTGDAVVDESSGQGSDFLAQLCVDWEAESRGLVQLGCRRIVLRTAPVLAADGGLLRQMALPFRLFLGGRVGSGRQYMSWIHLHDWVSMVTWAIETAELSGVLNATAPKPVTNKVFCKALGRALHRPSLLPSPPFALRLLFGEMADAMLLSGQRVMPKKALEMKFGFRYPDIDLAMRAAFAPTTGE